MTIVGRVECVAEPMGLVEVVLEARRCKAEISKLPFGTLRFVSVCSPMRHDASIFAVVS
jgi:hypothetical protein